MNLDDFRCMRRGRPLATVSKDDKKLLQAINRRNGDNQRALLLLHGFSSTPAVFRYLMQQLPPYDAIICPLLPGHGVNLDLFSQQKAGEWLPMTEKLCAELVSEFKEVDVLGLSLGGIIANHLATRFKLNHLYLLAPAFDLHLAINQSIQIARFLNYLGFRRLRSYAGNLFTTKACEIAFRQLPLPTIIEVLTFIKEFPFVPPPCPTDVFLGCHDEIVSSEDVALRYQPYAQATIHWLQQSAHVLPLDGDIETILTCINQHFFEASTKHHPFPVNMRDTPLTQKSM